MNYYLLFSMIFISFLSFAKNDIEYYQEIKEAKTNTEKEALYLEWVEKLSQSDITRCDSLIKNRIKYIDTISADGKIALLLSRFRNTQIGGIKNNLNLDSLHVDSSDYILVKNISTYLTKSVISNKDFKVMQKYADQYQDNTRKSLFYIISTFRPELDNDSRVDLLNKSIKFAKKSKLKFLPSAIYDIASKFFLSEEKFELAILNQQKGISFARRNELYANVANHLINIGEIQLKLGNNKSAIEEFKKAEKLITGLQLDYISGRLYNLLGRSYKSQDKIDQSIPYYQKSLIHFYNINNSEGLASAHKNIGKAYFLSKDFNLAKRNYNLSLEFYTDLTDPSGEADLFYLMSQLYLAENNISHAENLLQKAVDYWTIKRLKIPLHMAYLTFAEIRKKQGNYSASNDYLQQYISINDSIHQAKTEQKVAELSEIFKSKQKELIIDQQEKKLQKELAERKLIENQLTTSELKTNLLTAIFAISIGLFIAIFVIFKYKNKQAQLKNKQKETELQQSLLRSQMNPHFIFNAMTVIQSYIYDEDTSNSTKFLVHFSKLMRLILENNTKEFISLEKEMEIINRYLILQKMRFEDRFQFVIENETLKDPSNISIPPMLVQPFIENAIEHGNLDRVTDGLIRIRLEIKENLFIFIIEDNGIGRKNSAQNKPQNTKNHRSMAIDLTRERIDLLNRKYKGKGRLQIEDLNKIEETGTKVSISVVYKN